MRLFHASTANRSASLRASGRSLCRRPDRMRRKWFRVTWCPWREDRRGHGGQTSANDRPTLEDIRRFQLQLAETGASICNRNRIMTGLRFLFRVTLRRLDLAAEIYHLREPQKIPLVMSTASWLYS
jgi:hypothetical protein